MGQRNDTDNRSAPSATGATAGQRAIDETEALIAAAQKLRAKLYEDPHRPQYHFLPPEAWMNDINGSIYWKGCYHIFYQHNPEGGYWKWMQWGHASSTDLVHWVHHPIALTPTLGGPDRDGCFSGGAFLSREGVPTFIYHGVPDGTCLAKSYDDLLIHWTKHPANPVIKVPKPGEAGYGVYNVFDPSSAWIQNGYYYTGLGNQKHVRGDLLKGDGDTVYLFKSQDLAAWEYVGPFYESDRKWTEADEDNAVPDFFPLGDKHMMLFTSHLQGTQYYLGRLEGERFIPAQHARMSWPGGELGGGRTLQDGQGRRIYFDWIRERRGVERERESGWSGVMTLPRVLSLGDDGTLCIEPAPEMAVLRRNHRILRGIRLPGGSERSLDGVRGDALELALEMRGQSPGDFGVKVCCSPDGAEQTLISFDPAAKRLKVIMAQSSLDKCIQYPYYRNAAALARLPEEKRMMQAQEAPLELRSGESLRLRIFVDRSVLEVFANGRQCITQRIYPTRRDSLGVVLYSHGGEVTVQTAEAWDMAPAH